MKLVFMGTPDYAVPTLEALIKAGHAVAAVFCQPDKPVGRKQVLTAPPVKQCAVRHQIPVYQPTTFQDGQAAKQIKEIAPDLIAVVAYGKLLPGEVLTIPSYGCINGHASLLPKYRGASPIQWCIVSGETKTGVTTMMMDQGMDTGDILETVSTPIGPNETAEELFDRLAVLTAELMVKTVTDLQAGTVSPTKQSETGVSYAPLLKKEMAKLDFQTMTANEIHNAVRGFFSWPCAFFFQNGKRIKVLKTVLAGESQQPPGSLVASGKRLLIVCRDHQTVELVTVQPEGGKPMSGFQMFCGMHLT